MALIKLPLLLLLFAAGIVDGFKWMEKLKSPTLRNLRNVIKANQKFGDKKIVVITGTSSGLGKWTAKALLRSGKYHVVGGVRDMEKMKLVAKLEDFNLKDFTPIQLDLASFESVKNFVGKLDEFRADKPIDRVVCNAAVYQPSLPYAKWTVDDHEQQLQINYLSHFLLSSKLMPMMKGSEDPRMVMVGSVTGNDNTVGGGGVYPIADLKDLEGLELGCKRPISMIDGYNFNGAKAYKDTKLCLMMFSNMLHERYHRSTGIAFSSIYPGCIAESPLFREKRPWFRKYFPVFMKFITGGFVGEEEAGQRLSQVLQDPRCKKSGVYWSWNGGPREGRGLEAIEKGGQIVGAGGAGGGWDSIFENDQSDKVLNRDLSMKLWKLSNEVTGAVWPLAYQPKSPCPTLKVVGAATGILNGMEDRARMRNSVLGADPSLSREERREKLAQHLLAYDKTPEALREKEQKELLEAQNAATAAIAKPETLGGGTQRKRGFGWFGRGKSAEQPEPMSAMASEAINDDPVITKAEKMLDNLENILPEIDFDGENQPGNPFDLFNNKKKEGSASTPAGAGAPAMASSTLPGKKPYTIPKGHELLGNIPVVFQPENKATMARVGQPLSDVATQADVFIKYKCKKGECGTCAVNVGGKWVQACQTKIPSVPSGEVFGVTIRPVSEAKQKKEKARFFSPKSLVEGFSNNALGMVGFAKECVGATPDFDVRMAREKKIQEMVSKAKALKAENTNGRKAEPAP
mmetsp:Transcript_31128/g.54705  ORF Transcript_31128/g.54705 Transcript_31128/m.54705 type:complete len:744 (-) Transcript_31128:239-2470(-)|eukprot:CAMPEP_0197534458 /NCGR_PEP_ID=MMETSP1318-20131121/47254_1 /TAXON_ID=552666 /ORGANISM="Partenskyella glossopodia, Strain RCC365" /LENGTH=743 /DNA_ID=CAMNT_0043091743 /DNA_START=50 /DNA_END=2281 /DNA_ORIENTATION=+